MKIMSFDLDGTVLDSAEAICESANHVLRKNNLTELDESYLKSTIGRPLREVFEKVVPEEASVELLLNEFRQHLAMHSAEKTRVFPGIIESLDFLKSRGFKIAIATNKGTNLAKQVITSMKIENYFDLVVGQDLTKPKPLPDILFYIQKELNGKVLAMCGDTVDDIQTAKSAKVPAVAIASGAHDLEKLKNANPEFLIADATHLKTLIHKEFCNV